MPDAGYGAAAGIRRTVEEFEAAGVAAIHIEDQQSPKRCAQFPSARAVRRPSTRRSRASPRRLPPAHPPACW